MDTLLPQSKRKYFELIQAEVDVHPLDRQLEEHPELWDQNGFRKTIPGGPHSRMSDIWVRYNDDAVCKATGDWSTLNHAHDSVWYPAYFILTSLRLLIFNLMRVVEGERLGGVLITRIPAGEGIAPHIDKGWHVDYYDKYYLSVRSQPGANFCCADEFINPKVGDIWKFDNRNVHWVENKSDSDRITLIICIRRHHD